MKAVKIEIIMEDNDTANRFVTSTLEKLKEEFGFLEVFWSQCEYFRR